MPLRPSQSDALSKIQEGKGTWAVYAVLALDEAACLHKDLTSDQVWEVLTKRAIPFPPEPRGMGAVMVRGTRDGIVEPTNEFRVADEPATKRHGGRPQRVFKSLVYGDEPAKWPEIRTIVPTLPKVTQRIESFDEWRCPRCGRPLGGVIVTGDTGIGECVDHGRQRTQRRKPSPFQR